MLKASGYKTENYAPPLVNPYDVSTADRYMTRMPGEDLYSGMTPAQRSAQQLMEEYSRLNDATTRREEWDGRAGHCDRADSHCWRGRE